MERLRLTPTVIASIIATLIVVASVTSSQIFEFLSSHGISLKSKTGTVASACTPTSPSDKVYFVSCGGTF